MVGIYKKVAPVCFFLDDSLLSSPHEQRVERVARGAELSAQLLLQLLFVSRACAVQLFLNSTQVLSDLVLGASDLKFSSIDVENSILVHKKHSKLLQVLEFS